jgi:hypothetical protein
VTAQTSLPPVPPPGAVGDARLLQNQNQTRRGAPAADAVTGSGATALAAAPAIASPPVEPSGAVPRTLIRRPAVDENPFDPAGIAAGSFRLRPAIELSGGYDTNPARSTAGGGASLQRRPRPLCRQRPPGRPLCGIRRAHLQAEPGMAAQGRAAPRMAEFEPPGQQLPGLCGDAGRAAATLTPRRSRDERQRLGAAI